MNELWSATLNPNGPNYRTWLEILGSSVVPLESPNPGKTKFGDEEVEAYTLKLKAMTLKQRARLLTAIAAKFGKTVAEIEREVDQWGFPIRAADVIVAISARAAL